MIDHVVIDSGDRMLRVLAIACNPRPCPSWQSCVYRVREHLKCCQCSHREGIGMHSLAKFLLVANSCEECRRYETNAHCV